MVFSFNFLFIVGALLALVSDEANTNPSEIQLKLDNGLTVHLLPSARYSLAAAVLAIKAGTSRETAETNGYLHLLEHCLLFRQSGPGDKDNIFRAIKEYGLYYNAHTEQDLMFFEICVPSGFLKQGLNLLRQIVFNFNLEKEALEREKTIILKELADISRVPQKVGLAKIYELVFPDSPYALPTFGRPEVIKKADIESLREFYSRYFTPENAVLVIVGDFEPQSQIENIKKDFSEVKSSAEKSEVAREEVKAKVLGSPLEITMEVSDTYLIGGLPGPDYSHPDSFGLDLLIEILGRGLNPLFYAAFAGYPGLVHSVNIDYLSHERAGLIFFMITTRAERLPTVKRLVQQFLIKVSDFNFSKNDFLPDEQSLMVFDFLLGGKNRILFSAEKFQENPLQVALALARHLQLSPVQQKSNYLEAINSLSSSDLRRLSYKYLSQNKPAWVIIRPK